VENSKTEKKEVRNNSEVKIYYRNNPMETPTISISKVEGED